MLCKWVLLVRLSVFSLLFLLTPSLLHAQYKALETKNLRLLYRDILHSSLAPYAARCFENSMDFYAQVFNYSPSEKVNILLDDSNDFNNAAAFASPRNTLLIQIAPANMVYETIPSNERLNHTMNHELAHIVALDQASGDDRFFRFLFNGKVAADPEHPESILYEYLTHPRFAAPRWYHEGLAVFLETWMAGGIGRAQGSYDEMVFRSMVRDKTSFYDPLGLESEGTKTDFQVGANSYLYGTRFITYLGYQYSPEQIIQWAARGKGSKKYYASQFKAIFGMSISEAWQQWILWEQEFQQVNLDAIRQYPLTPFRDLSTKALGSVSRPYYDRASDKLYLGLFYPGVLAHLASLSLNDGAIDKISDVKGPALYYVTSLTYDSVNKTLYYTTDNNTWRDLNSIDLVSGKKKRLIRDGRIGDLVLDETDRSIWAVRHFNGISTLVRLEPPYENWSRIHSWIYGEDIYDIDISSDGTLFSYSMSEPSGRQTLRLADMDRLRQRDATSKTLYDFENSVPANFVFSPDGRYLFGSSYYTGVSNIWRYTLATQKMEIVTNCDTGFFRPVPLAEDSLLVFRYTGLGFVPALIEVQPLEDVSGITLLGQQLAEKHPIVEEWNVGSPASVPLDSLIQYHGPYKTFGNFGLASVYPVSEGYKNYGAVGLRFNLSDPGFWNSAHLTVSYTPTTQLDKNERLHVRAEFSRSGWTGKALLNAADFYDWFGPTKSSRKGYGFGLSYDKNLIFDRPKELDLHVSTIGYGDLESLPWAQNISSGFDKLLSSNIELHYKNLRRSLGAVDAEKGYTWKASLGNTVANGEAFPNVEGSFDFGVPFLFHHASLWLRSAAGYSPGDREDPFSNFFFGGFGNNWVDRLDEKRYRESYSFPGLELNEIGGTNYSKATIEWNLPPLRFRRLGTPALHATWMRPSIFVSGLITNMEESLARKTIVNAGSQLDFRFSLLSRLKMTFSLGYALAFEKHHRTRDEFMFSLKVL